MSRLPSVLGRWEESLAGVDAQVALAVGPLLPLVEELVGRLDLDGGGTGEPDGYDGTTNRGDLARLLPEEWLLASEVPDEFLRRAAEQELSYLRIARRAQAPRGRVLAVVDTGPEQLGAGRLVQLAALVVLHRRATAAGTELVMVLVGDRSPVPITPDGLPEALDSWLRSRSARVPSAEDVATAFAAAELADHVWLLGGPAARRHAPSGHRRSVSAEVVRWDDAGARRLAVRVGDSSAEVDVPDPAAAVAALRGRGISRRTSDPTVRSVATSGRGAVFHSADNRLLWRGESDRELLGSLVARDAKVRRYDFSGTVLAANSLGKRVVAAVTDGRAMWIQVVGKNLGRTHRTQVPLADLGIDTAALEALVAEPLRPLHYSGGEILLRLPSGWWGLEESRCWEAELLAVGPGRALDAPLTIPRHAWDRATPIDLLSGAGPAAGPVLGPPVEGGRGSWVAWSSNTRTWQLARGREVVDEIAVEERDRVIGLGLVAQQPFLLVVSESGRIVRQVSSTRIRTWTRFAGPAHFSLHPHHPWLARSTDDRITVGDLTDGTTLLEIKVEP